MSALAVIPLLASGLTRVADDTALLASDGAAFDEFGRSVAVSGDYAIVGSHLDSHNFLSAGSVYVYEVASGAELRKLTAGDAANFASFGTDVALDGTTALIGALDNEKGDLSGSAYLFEILTGAEQQELIPADGAEGDLFGGNVALTGDFAIVASRGDDDNGEGSGSVYIFRVSTGEELRKITPADGAAGDSFGSALAAFGDHVVIGSQGDDDNGDFSGSAYVYEIATGDFVHKLTASDGIADDAFGFAVDLNGKYVVVGSLGNSEARDFAGAAYVFDLATGNELRKLTPPDAVPNNGFGWSVAINGDHVLVGSPSDPEIGPNAGAAYVFDAATGTALAKLLPCPCETLGLFGRDVGLDGNTAIAGSIFDATLGASAGAAYVFDVTEPIIVEPEIALAVTEAGEIALTFTGQLEASDDADDWSAVVPAPWCEYTTTLSGERQFFRAVAPAPAE